MEGIIVQDMVHVLDQIHVNAKVVGEAHQLPTVPHLVVMVLIVALQMVSVFPIILVNVILDGVEQNVMFSHVMECLIVMDMACALPTILANARVVGDLTLFVLNSLVMVLIHALNMVHVLEIILVNVILDGTEQDVKLLCVTLLKIVTKMAYVFQITPVSAIQVGKPMQFVLNTLVRM